MNRCDQSRPNMKYMKNNPWSKNTMTPNNHIHRKSDFNSTWVAHHQMVNRMSVKPDFADSENYWCETCDKGFMTKTLLYNHTRRHQKCNIDGCQFVAHPLVITKHIQMQHATGLYKRIGKLVNPEEIKKWREERKKKYPTKVNIEKKKEEIKEKIGRGEKMGLWNETKGIKKPVTTRHVQHNRGKHRNNTFLEKNNRTKGNRITTTQKCIKNNLSKKQYNIGPPEGEIKKLQPFRGIQNLVVENNVEDVQEQTNDLFEDEEDISVKEENTNNTQPTLCGALTSLMCTYESSDEYIEENFKHNHETIINSDAITVKPEVKDNKNQHINVNNIKCSNDSENESGPEEMVINKEEPTVNVTPKPVKPPKKDRHQRLTGAKNINRIANFKRKLPSTLLEKLLHKEIQHERNVILQCVRFVVKNNYFEK